MDDRKADAPANDRHPPTGTPPDTEVRPLGALAITGFLVVVILGLWFGMYALNVVRN
ncbi:MAG: cytochrome c oxidase subunit 2A [Trueperaceae bacterium]|nr:cytochrome c oxidase subunit 2A [Trueperaceae bacterium]